jgi:hypothetical protein
MNEAIFGKLEQRLGRLHAKLRLGIETDHEAQILSSRQHRKGVIRNS